MYISYKKQAIQIQEFSILPGVPGITCDSVS